MEENGVVAVLLRRPPEFEAPIVVLEAVAPGLRRERRVHDDEVEAPQLTSLGELRAGKRVTLLDIGVLVAVQSHVHLGKRPSGVILLLPIDRDAARRFSFQHAIHIYLHPRHLHVVLGRGSHPYRATNPRTVGGRRYLHRRRSYICLLYTSPSPRD